MPDRNPAAIDFLLSRRSCPARSLKEPAPDRTELTDLLRAAARTPDHGKLQPWRFIVLHGAALTRLGALARELGPSCGVEPEKIEKTAQLWEGAPLVVAVIAAPCDNPKIPTVEQVYSAGAACLGLLNAALASGWGANWITGWCAHDPAFLGAGLGLKSHESVVGFVHIGSCDTIPPERPRPDLNAIVEWVDQ